jgi:hypothetical protein
MTVVRSKDPILKLICFALARVARGTVSGWDPAVCFWKFCTVFVGHVVPPATRQKYLMLLPTSAVRGLHVYDDNGTASCLA